MHESEKSGDGEEEMNNASPCGGDFSNIVFADMHDGDTKKVSLEGNKLTIEPPTQETNNESYYIIQSNVDLEKCTAMVNFDVPGKPNPPPVPLLVTFFWMETALVIGDEKQSSKKKLALEFTDPSETIAPSKNYPLNVWVELLEL